MRTNSAATLLVSLLVLVLGACRADDEAVTDTATAVAVPEGAPVGDAPGTVGSVELTVASSQEHGRHIADASGRALYLLESDSANTSTCHDACAQAWPPLLSRNDSASVRDGQDLQAAQVGTIRRRDGGMQVTYNGHPLYYYAKDAGPGQTTGQDVTDAWGEWYLVTPQGAPLEHH